MKNPILPLCFAASLGALLAAVPRLPVDPAHWWGFNLMEKVDVGWHKNAPYREEDFAMTADLGFNYLRLPIDYRCLTEKDHWLSFREEILKHLDDAVAWGEKYRVHISLGYHRAPGYCVNPPAEAKSLWTDDEALAAFVGHWEHLARRYRRIPPERLSFNLVNEPSGTDRSNVVRVYARTLEAIRRIDAKRVVLLDGGDGGVQPYGELADAANVIHSGRGYYFPISLYKASYRDKSRDLMPTPFWPMRPQVYGNLYGTDKEKEGLKIPLVLAGPFKAGTRVALNVYVVSRKCELQARADGREVWRKNFEPKDGPGEWLQVNYRPEYDRYQNVYHKEFGFVLDRPAKEIALENLDGDWLRFTELIITPRDGKEVRISADQTPRLKQQRYEVGADGNLVSPPDFDPEFPITRLLAPWKALAEGGAPVFLGEFGTYNKTPHPVYLSYTRSLLEQCRRARFGWAMWNLRGEFGVLDSGRADAVYEDYRGHKLDRKMMDLLMEFRRP
ncbi:MAG: cellulase family glycosylhydrolase [Spirochaetes bacterium]|nr:cellulase family glycosylhydrolase [Spirochaetota bacterium]